MRYPYLTRGRFGLDGGFEKRIAIGSWATVLQLPKIKRNDNNNYAFAA